MAKIGKFEIQEQLGHGGMGVVYRAWDTKMERLVALKTISPDKATRAEFIKRFRREALSAGRLDHPNVVTIYEFDEQDDVCFIAMQFLEGSDLEGLLASPRWQTEFPVFRKLDILIQTCQGLGYAHRNGVVHRDVKPANIMILPDGTAKLVDFGIARLGDITSGTSNLLLGTAPYMAPEQLEGRPADERLDVFAVGVIAYRMFTGHFPFDGPNVSSILYKIIHDAPPPLSTYLADVPAELERILLMALAKDREQRFRTMDEFGFELQRLLSSLNASLVSSYIEEARRLVLLRDYPRSKDLLRKVLELEPGNPGATALWQQVQKLLQQEFVKRKLQGLLSDGIEAYERGEWVRALDCFEQGMKLDPGHEMLQTYRNLTLREQEKTAAASSNLKAAREALQRRDLAGARRCLSKVLDLNPENTDALGLLAQVDTELADVEKQRSARQYLDRAQQALSAGQFGEALSLLDKAHALDPENPQAGGMRSVVLAEQAEAEQQKVRAEKIAAAQAALDRQDFAVAAHQAEVGLRVFPNDPALQQLQARANQGLEAARRRKQIGEQIQLAHTLVEQGDLVGARKIAASVRERDRQDPRLQALAQSLAELEERLDRERLRDAELDRARELMRASRHDDARRVLEEARDRFGRSAPLQELLTFLTQEVKRLQQEGEVRDILRQAAASCEAEEPAKAVQLLRKAARKYKQQALNDELARAEKLTQEAEERRAFFDQAAKLIKKKLWEQAVSHLGVAPETYRRHPRFKELWQAAASAVRSAGGTQDEIPTGAVGAPLASAAGAGAGVGAAAAAAPAREPGAQRSGSARGPSAAMAPTRAPSVTPAAPGARLLALLARPRTLMYLVPSVVLATVLGIVAAGRFTSRSPDPAPTAPTAGTAATVRLDVTPWADIVEIKNQSSGEILKIPGQTPMELTIPPGVYRVLLRHPRLGEMAVTVQAEPGAVRSIRHSFAGFGPEQILKSYD